MFERRKIRKAVIHCAKATNLRDDEGEYIIFAVTNSPMMGAAVGGIKQGLLAGPYVAVTYLCAAIIDAVSRSEIIAGEHRMDAALEDAHRGEVAAKCALAAMSLAGATNEEAVAMIEELVSMHRRSAENLEQAVMARAE